jgi:hypothetical protein
VSKRYNGGNGARICDDCRIMLTSGSRVLRPSISVELETNYVAPFEDTGPSPWDFCCVECLETRACIMAGLISSIGERGEYTIANLGRLHMMLAHVRGGAAVPAIRE